MNELQTKPAQDPMKIENVSLLLKVEIDSQIATAKAYPRDLKKCFDEAMTVATFNQDIAESCMYAIPRDGKMIEGASIRLAEIMLNAWENIHCSTRLVKNDGKFIAVEAIVIDRQKNVIYSETVERSIMTSAKKGTPRQYSYDMQQTTAAAAASIALRKAAFRLIPKQFVELIYEEAKKVALGINKNQQDGKKHQENIREKAVKQFEKSGISPEKILSYFEVQKIEDLTMEHLSQMIGLKNAILSGDLKKENAFDKSYNAETGEVIANKADEVNEKLGLTEQANDQPLDKEDLPY